MLFSYTYVPHQMEKMQDFIDFIFYEVWCKAPIGIDFHPDLFDNDPELQSIMSEFGYSANAAKRGKKFYKEVKATYELFASLSGSQIEQLKKYYEGNNDLEKVCRNDPAMQLAHYRDIAAINNELAAQLKNFFQDLFSNDLLKLAPLKAKIGDIGNHYRTFVSINIEGKCPFCGISNIKGIDQGKREAYDHYLPKSLYPFNSINFRNLAPACHECNSTNKSSKDPAHSLTGRRKAFNPYAEVGYTIQLRVSLLHSDIEKLTPTDISLQFGPLEIQEEIDTWTEIYGIEKRYKEIFCTKNNGKYWLVRALDEWPKNYSQPIDYLDYLDGVTQNYPYADDNFLRKPFLDACRQIGIL